MRSSFITIGFALLLLGTITTPVNGARFRGYLADRLCVEGIVAADGANMITAPHDHSVKCALMPPCIASGYTLLTPPSPGQTTYGQMYNLSAESNVKAVTFLRSLALERTNLLVEVDGDWENGVLTVTTLHFQDLGTSALTRFTGIVADRLCLDGIVAADGSNMILRPEDHSIKCLLMPSCVASGFTIILAPSDLSASTTCYGAMYNFTDASNSLVEAWARRLPGEARNLRVWFYGTVDAFGKLTIMGPPSDPSNPVINSAGDHGVSGASSQSLTFTVAVAALALLLL